MNFILRRLMLLWFILATLICWEYYTLNWSPQLSLLTYLKPHFFPSLNLITDPGRPISYWLGWAGFGTICVTNFYILRKRWLFMQKWGRPRNWLEFHIFCGLLGPTLIVAHCDFKVSGLVAISFWSMMVVAVSGVLGRYFYLQASGENKNLRAEIGKWEERITRMIQQSGKEVPADSIDRMKSSALAFVGATHGGDSQSLIGTIAGSLMGDIRLLFRNPAVLSGLHPYAGDVLSGYALAVRKENHLSHFERLLGYWHSFHVPFTITMYITALIHIVVAQLFLAE